jgi:hypothetical protein
VIGCGLARAVYRDVRDVVRVVRWMRSGAFIKAAEDLGDAVAEHAEKEAKRVLG